jgi:hypothetical protein
MWEVFHLTRGDCWKFQSLNMKKKPSSIKAADKKVVGDENGKLKSLSPEDSIEFEKLNAIIDQGMESVFEVGSALVGVKTRKLYVPEFGTWKRYLKEKFSIGCPYASRLMRAAETVEQLKERLPIGNVSVLPVNETQVRPLLRLKELDDRALAWQKAVESSVDGKPIALDVTQAVSDLLWEKEGVKTPSAPQKTAAVLANGKKVPAALSPTGYLNAELAQQKLDQIRDRADTPEPRKIALQRFFLGVCGSLNHAVEADPGSEEEIMFLIRDIIKILPLAEVQSEDLAPVKAAA